MVSARLFLGSAKKLTDKPDDKGYDDSDDDYTCPDTGFKDALDDRAARHE